jgi:hypothetical protein
MPGMPPNCAAAGKTGKTASTSTNATARLNVMILFPRHTPTPDSISGRSCRPDINSPLNSAITRQDERAGVPLCSS